MFSQTFAGALFLSFSDTIFTNSLSTLIPTYAPSVDPQTIINAGATDFRTYVSESQLGGVLLAYAKSVDRVFYLTTGMACGCFFFSFFMGWKDIRTKKSVSKAWFCISFHFSLSSLSNAIRIQSVQNVEFVAKEHIEFVVNSLPVTRSMNDNVLGDNNRSTSLQISCMRLSQAVCNVKNGF